MAAFHSSRAMLSLISLDTSSKTAYNYELCFSRQSSKVVPLTR